MTLPQLLGAAFWVLVLRYMAEDLLRSLGVL